MYSMKLDSMTIPIHFNMYHKSTTIEALLDSGATHNFIDKHTLDLLGLGTRQLSQTLQVNNVNSTTNQGGNVTRFCNLWLNQGDRTFKLGFYIANLGRDQVILGHPWFKSFNPHIDWTTNQLIGPDVVVQTAGYRTKQRSSLQSITIKPPEDQTETQQLIPPQYHRHWLVFSEQAAQCFPPSRIDDHAITLKPGAPDTLDCKIYHQTEEELKVTWEFIDNSLAKGYIRESKSPYMSPMFYRAKQDGTL
jgi:hypothetical protein